MSSFTRLFSLVAIVAKTLSNSEVVVIACSCSAVVVNSVSDARTSLLQNSITLVVRVLENPSSNSCHSFRNSSFLFPIDGSTNTFKPFGITLLSRHFFKKDSCDKYLVFLSFRLSNLYTRRPRSRSSTRRSYSFICCLWPTFSVPAGCLPFIPL